MLPDDYDLPVFDGPTVNFVVHYDPSQEEAALLLARRIFADLDLHVESMTLVPEDGSDFDLWLEGQQIHSTRASGREPSALAACKLAWQIIRSADTSRPDIT